MGYPGKATTVISLKDKHIGRRIRKVGSFTEGARAIDNERNIGKILRLYDNGKAVLAFDKHQVGPGTVGSLVKLSNLSLTTSPCVNLSK
jgi:hypothetical protein